jgi:hypothetical protein
MQGCAVKLKSMGFSVMPIQTIERPDGLICGLPIHPKLVFDVKVTETISSNLTMAQAGIKDKAGKTYIPEKNVKFKTKVAAEGALLIPLSISTIALLLLYNAGGLGGGYKRVFDLLVKHAAEYRSIPPGALRRYRYRLVWPTVSISMLGVLILHHYMMSLWVKALCLHSLMLALFLFPTEGGVWDDTFASRLL